MRALQEGVLINFGASKYNDALQLVKQRIELLQQEGIATPDMLSSAEWEAQQVCALAGKHDEAMMWLKQAHMHAVIAQGADSVFAQKLAGLMHPVQVGTSCRISTHTKQSHNTRLARCHCIVAVSCQGVTLVAQRKFLNSCSGTEHSYIHIVSRRGPATYLCCCWW